MLLKSSIVRRIPLSLSADVPLEVPIASSVTLTFSGTSSGDDALESRRLLFAMGVPVTPSGADPLEICASMVPLI